MCAGTWHRLAGVSAGCLLSSTHERLGQRMAMIWLPERRRAARADAALLPNSPADCILAGCNSVAAAILSPNCPSPNYTPLSGELGVALAFRVNGSEVFVGSRTLLAETVTSGGGESVPVWIVVSCAGVPRDVRFERLIQDHALGQCDALHVPRQGCLCNYRASELRMEFPAAISTFCRTQIFNNLHAPHGKRRCSSLQSYAAPSCSSSLL